MYRRIYHASALEHERKVNTDTHTEEEEEEGWWWGLDETTSHLATEQQRPKPDSKKFMETWNIVWTL